MHPSWVIPAFNLEVLHFHYLSDVLAPRWFFLGHEPRRDYSLQTSIGYIDQLLCIIILQESGHVVCKLGDAEGFCAFKDLIFQHTYGCFTEVVGIVPSYLLFLATSDCPFLLPAIIGCQMLLEIPVLNEKQCLQILCFIWPACNSLNSKFLLKTKLSYIITHLETF